MPSRFHGFIVGRGMGRSDPACAAIAQAYDWHMDELFVEQAQIDFAADLLTRANYLIVLTGAGISKESGIPTFRGKDGLWTLNGEPPMNQFETFSQDPKRWWERRLEQQSNNDFGARIRSAEPNDAHFALARLESAGIVKHVITQNVDNLHRRAGQLSLTEIHGNSRWMRCVECNHRWPADEFAIDVESLPPRCSERGCDGIVKGDGVMFGEPIPPDALERCYAETARCDLFLLVGTSAVVYPAAAFPQMAARRGVPLIEVDPELTALSEVVDVALRGPAGEVLPRIADAVLGRART
jgi:NAD-dependent deacetylase